MSRPRTPSAARRFAWALPLLIQLTPVLADDLRVGSLSASLTAEQLDWESRSDGEVLNWDGHGRVGTERHRLWLRSEGERLPDNTINNRLEMLWGQPLDGWELMLGARHDSGELPARTYAAVGAQSLPGTALQWDVTAYVGDGSEDGADVHGGLRIQTRYGWQLLQGLFLRVRAEAEYWSEDHVRLTEGSGPCELRAGLRLGYDPVPDMGWYIGGEWLYQIQDTARLTELQGGNPREARLVTGLRISF